MKKKSSLSQPEQRAVTFPQHAFLTAHLDIKKMEELLPDLPKYRTKQIYRWILKGSGSFDSMTDIPQELKDELKTRFNIFSGKIVSCHESGTAGKIVIECFDGSKIESVLLKDSKDRYTACISSQAGCPCGCVFCMTGTLGFRRNLEYAEIAEQYLHLLNICKGKPDTQKINSGGNTGKNQNEHIIDNIVIMGMGEPLLNLDNLRKSIEIFTDPNGLNISKRRITVSTCGISSSLFDIAENGPFIKLALSLTTADEKLRALLMPVTEFNPLAKLKEALMLFQKNGGGRITLEIPLLAGINTREKDASSIRSFANGLSVIINIIPWNPVAGIEFNGAPLREPDKRETAEFIRMLENLNMNVTMRLHKGRSVMGACGQLGMR